MSNPSFSNIDMWLFELAEGNLSPEQVEQLEIFLLNNPDVDIDRDVWQMAKVEKQAITYPNTADLERKRRPVVFFALPALLLLLLGSGSYMAYHGQFVSAPSVDLSAQNEQVKRELQTQIRNWQNQANGQNSLKTVSKNSSLDKLTQRDAGETILVAANQNVGQINNFGANNNSLNNAGSNNVESTSIESTNTGSNIDISTSSAVNNSNSNNADSNNADANNASTNASNLAASDGNGMLITKDSNQNFTTHSIGLVNTASAQTQFLDPSVTNSDNEGYVTELKKEEGISKDDENREYSVIRPSEIDGPEGRDWNDRKTPTSARTLTSTGNDSRTSFKDRLDKFGRSLDHMMNAPIALKNSRDPHYHVPGMTSNDINFSSTGTLVATRVQTTSRLQWQGQENEQLMNQLAVDGYSHGIRGGLGIQLNHQWYKDGGIQVAQAALTYSPKISVSNWISVEPSIRFKMGNKRLNVGQMQSTSVVELDRGNAHDFYTNGATPIGQSLWYKDLGLGLLVNTKWFFVGVQADNLFKYKDNLYDINWSDPRRAQNHFTATIGSDWVSRNEKLSLSPYVVYQKNENLSEAWLGANFSWNWFNLGLATSSNLEPAASIGMKFAHFSLHYNADYTQSKMLDKKALSHQLTLRFVAKQNRFGKQLFKR